MSGNDPMPGNDPKLHVKSPAMLDESVSQAAEDYLKTGNLPPGLTDEDTRRIKQKAEQLRGSAKT